MNVEADTMANSIVTNSTVEPVHTEKILNTSISSLTTSIATQAMSGCLPAISEQLTNGECTNTEQFLYEPQERPKG